MGGSRAGLDCSWAITSASVRGLFYSYQNMIQMCKIL